MANRFPLVLNTSSNQLQELASGDTLDLTGSGLNLTGITTLSSSAQLNLSGGTNINTGTRGDILFYNASGNIQKLSLGATGKILKSNGSDLVYGDSGTVANVYYVSSAGTDASGFGGSIDQISNLINNIKENPSSRRHLVSAWNVSDLKYMTLPPCHYAFQVYVRGDYLDLMWHQRSADLFLGVPFNISSYATLLHILAMATGKRAGKLKASFGDMHLYLNHTKAAIKQLDRKTYKLPEIHFAPTFYDALVNRGLDEALNVAETNMFKLLDYKYSPTLKAKLNN